MDIKPKFINRKNDTKAKAVPFNAQAVIKYFLALHPNNRLIPNSPLYLEAVKQYNTNVKKTMVRPAIPNWFCGKVNSTTNELVPTIPDNILRAASGVVRDIPPSIPEIVKQSITGYLPDECLIYGTPGSVPYTLRCTNVEDPNDDRDTGLSFSPIVGDTIANAGCLPIQEAVWESVVQQLTLIAWNETKHILVNFNVMGLDQNLIASKLPLWNLWYENNQTPGVGEQGPMKLSIGEPKACLAIDEGTTQVRANFHYSDPIILPRVRGDVSSRVHINNEDLSIIDGTFGIYYSAVFYNNTQTMIFVDHII
jgi:hypothetical protein